MPSIPQPLSFDSAEIDYSGVELVLRFRRPVTTSYSHPFLTAVQPVLTSPSPANRSCEPKGGNFEVVPATGGDDLVWTLRYRIAGDRVTHDEGATLIVSWSGGTLASDGQGCVTATSATGYAVTNRSRVDENGWTVLPLRDGTGVIGKAPDDPSLAAGLYAWYSPQASGYTPFSQNADGTGAVANDGDPIGRWADRSGNNRHMTQSNANNKPTYQGASGGVVNGHPAARFNPLTSGNASNLNNTTDFNLSATSNKLSVVAVVRSNGNSVVIPGQPYGRGHIVQQGTDGGTTSGHHLFMESPQADYTPGAPGRRPVKTRVATRGRRTSKLRAPAAPTANGSSLSARGTRTQVTPTAHSRVGTWARRR